MSAADEARRLAVIGLAFALVLAAAGLFAVINPFGGRSANRISVVIDTPYIGQGVTTGTGMMMHGVRVGEVTTVASRPGGGVRVHADLQSGAIAGLTDTLGIDFRPINYFGVTGINLIPGSEGRKLSDGMRIDAIPRGNFTLQTLLSHLGELTDGVVTPQLIRVIDRATRYTDALNPLIETMLIAAKAVTAVQTVSTEQLLTNTTGVSVVFPAFAGAATTLGNEFTNAGLVYFDHSGEFLSEDFWINRYTATIELSSTGLFQAVGELETSHIDELIPAVGLVKLLTDVVPGLARPEGIADTLVELRTRLEKLYGGSPDQRALQVHVVLDNLPGVAAPLGSMGGPS